MRSCCGLAWIAGRGLLAAGLLGLAASAGAYERTPGPHGVHFERRTREIEALNLAQIRTGDDWRRAAPGYRAELAWMLGLPSMENRPALKAETTGSFEKTGYRVENVVFQSLPGLYVTGNLYLPARPAGKIPAVLYVCGHGTVKEGGVSYGSKAAYQRYGPWFARNGYACLIIDTLQLAEIEGLHHGTHREGMWWWPARGYTPAGVEAWNAIRAVDYLQSRPEVDAERIGMTGRSGGGATSWWGAAMDDRIKVAAPTAGIADMRNHVVDGVIEGHCDCMYPVNSSSWDFAAISSLVAPRPLLLVNTDSDPIFPLDGVMRVQQETRRIYGLLGASENFGLVISEGGHKDWPEMQVAVMRWFNRHLKGEESAGAGLPVAELKPEELRVLRSIPSDQKNTRIHESFVPAASPRPIKTAAEWDTERRRLEMVLRDRIFRAWPASSGSNAVPEPGFEREGLRVERFILEAEPGLPVRLTLVRPAAGGAPGTVDALVATGEWDSRANSLWAGESGSTAEWRAIKEKLTGGAGGLLLIQPRGTGAAPLPDAERARTHLRRRYLLLGESLEAMQVWDVVQALRWWVESGTGRAVAGLEGSGEGGLLALYASLYAPVSGRLTLENPPLSHREAARFIDILRYMDVPQAVSLALRKNAVRLTGARRAGWEHPLHISGLEGFKGQGLEILAPGM